MKKLGQHFLKNTGVVKRMVAAIGPRAGEAIIEIGPGHGALTVPLAAACAEAGARLAVIEKDERLAEKLRELSSGHSIEIITGDALEIIGEMMDRPRKDGMKIVGNIPYYITGKLLRTIGDAARAPERCVFMVQREVAERIMALPPKMNRLAASVQYWADGKIIARVPREDFSPPPTVDSAVIELASRHRGTKNPSETSRYYLAIRTIFAQPRKTLLNNLGAARKASGKALLPEKIKELGLDPGIRPQNLSREDIARVAEALF
jgi:16S rRNA (adenine1518-N6/adenine1519-N6)-dimethyltransferase